MTNKANYQQDLWPDDLQTITVVSPKTIVEEQGRILGKKLNNIIVGEVKQAETMNVDFDYDFYFYCSPLNYRYRLFEFYFDVNNYPVKIKPDSAILQELARQEQESPIVIANTEEEFLEILRKIFAAQKTRRVIAGILSQVQPANVNN